MVDDVDQDPFTAFNNPSLAFTFDGLDAAARASSAVLTTTSVCQPLNHTDHVTYEWSSVTVPPGGMVAYMHFVTQQTSRSSAAASAERLVQLPPEALSGLSPEEAAAVRNFAVPAQSALAPLSLTGTITGRLLEYDATTLSPGSQVTFKSSHPIFARTYQVFATNGQFSLTSNFSGDFNSRIVPVHDFTLSTRPD